MNYIDMGEFVTYLKSVAEERRMNAGFNGEVHDGGAQEMLNQISAFEAGLAGKLPDLWKGHFSAFKREQNPRYAEYLKMKEEFGE